MEGESVTLEWTYNLQGEDLDLIIFSTQSGELIVRKVQTNAPRVSAIFSGQIEVNATESFASIKFLSINRTHSKTYTLTVSNTKLEQDVDQVEIQVQCKLCMIVNYYNY